MRDAVLGPAGTDEGRHAHRFIASLTHRAVDPVRTSVSTAGSAWPARSRASQFPSVPWLIPRSRTACAVGLPVSLT